MIDRGWALWVPIERSFIDNNRWSVFLQFFCVCGSTILWIAMFWDFAAFSKGIMYFHIMSSVLMFQIAFIFTSA